MREEHAMVSDQCAFRRGATEFGEMWGNLDAPIWICGIEPGGEGIHDLRTPSEYSYPYKGQSVPCWSRRFRDDNLRDACRESDARDRWRARYVNWPFCRNSAKLAIGIVAGDVDSQWREYYRPDLPSHRDDWCYGGSKGAVLCLNLYPLNFSSTDVEWSSAHVDATGFASKDDYREWCQKYRFDRIRSLAFTHRPAAIVCAGGGWREDFMSAFGVPCGAQQPISSLTLPDMRRSCEAVDAGAAGSRMFLIPHLSRTGQPRHLWTNNDLITAAVWIRRKMCMPPDDLATFWPPCG